LGAYANFELARIYLDRGQPEIAEKTLSELINSNPLFGPAYKLLGTIYNLKGDTGLGNKLTVRSNDFIPFSPPVDSLADKIVLLSRSELYLLKKIDEAEKSFHSDWALKLVNQGLQYMPDNNYLISKAIKIYLWKNLNEQAIALTDRHLKLFWENFAEIKNTGMFFFQKGIYPQAAKYWTRALELKPAETLIQEYLAKCLWATGDKQKSLEILNSIIEKNKDNPDVIADVTVLLIQFGAKEAAAENHARLKKMAPANPKVQKISGEIAEANGEIQNAITFYESAFKGDTQDVETIKNLGELYLKQQMWEKYINLYRKANEYHPNNPDFLARLGEVLISCPVISLQNIEEGKYYTERAFTYYNCPPDIIVAAGSHLAYAYSLLGDKQKAITTISQTINIGRRQNIPADQQAKLENMLSAFRNMSN
jgi:tetratricopeptide (TPR) repeat protein